jgi:hypothetical protein
VQIGRRELDARKFLSRVLTVQRFEYLKQSSIETTWPRSISATSGAISAAALDDFSSAS